MHEGAVAAVARNHIALEDSPHPPQARGLRLRPAAARGLLDTAVRVKASRFTFGLACHAAHRERESDADS